MHGCYKYKNTVVHCTITVNKSGKNHKILQGKNNNGHKDATCKTVT